MKGGEMMAKRKTANNSGRILALETGQTYNVVGETNLYWICEGTQFKKTNEQIQSVTVREDAGKENSDG